jgi:hypothetical protein
MTDLFAGIPAGAGSAVVLGVIFANEAILDPAIRVFKYLHHGERSVIAPVPEGHDAQAKFLVALPCAIVRAELLARPRLDFGGAKVLGLTISRDLLLSDHGDAQRQQLRLRRG